MLLNQNIHKLLSKAQIIAIVGSGIINRLATHDTRDLQFESYLYIFLTIYITHICW